jgi:hypothetical protein
VYIVAVGLEGFSYVQGGIATHYVQPCSRIAPKSHDVISHTRPCLPFKNDFCQARTVELGRFQKKYLQGLFQTSLIAGIRGVG